MSGNQTDLYVTIPAVLASGAHQMGEETSLVVFLVARALDAKGSGRVLRAEVEEGCGAMLSSRQVARVLRHPASGRYWELEERFLRLHAEASILGSFPCELLRSGNCRRFPVRVLDSRPRRGAALLSAILAGIDNPRSNQFISRFARVDRKTVSRWMRDTTITEHILRRLPMWTTA